MNCDPRYFSENQRTPHQFAKLLDQAVAASHENNYAMATISHRDATTKLGSNRLNSATTIRRNLTEAEKEVQRLRRILANRESARQTVPRRRAMHTELTRQVVDLSAENENLKKASLLLVFNTNIVLSF
ncbi:basic leucine zipper 63-like isoform X3 [Salvia splendens]|uniref:basic leucine zipper 63-like isoform X3 n=1 Tax=Salvia splendens TaxID=180675 RepID=UPI001C262141|nr:basic leucine zipper 63-like isoform X3 [Salvia splendens]